MVEENVILVLENGEKFIVLNKVQFDSTDYFLTMGIKDNNEVIQSKVLFIKSIFENGDNYIIKVKNYDLISKLTTLLKNLT